MLVRIQGEIESIDMQDGISKAGKHWAKKVYVVKDKFSKVHVNDFGKARPESYEHEFDFKSNHVVGEKVDLACYLETNDAGFTNVNYGKPYDEIESKPAATAQATDEPQEVEPQEPLDETTELPF